MAVFSKKSDPADGWLAGADEVFFLSRLFLWLMPRRPARARAMRDNRKHKSWTLMRKKAFKSELLYRKDNSFPGLGQPPVGWRVFDFRLSGISVG